MVLNWRTAAAGQSIKKKKKVINCGPVKKPSELYPQMYYKMQIK